MLELKANLRERPGGRVHGCNERHDLRARQGSPDSSRRSLDCASIESFGATTARFSAAVLPENPPGKGAGMFTSIRAILVCAFLLGLASACGGEASSTGATTAAKPAATTAEPPPTTTEEESRCVSVPAALVAGIETGLTVAGGGSLRDAQAVRSKDFRKMYFISAEIDGPGLEDDGDIGTWASNSLKAGTGLIFAVDGVANEFSDWGDGGETDAGLSLSDDGAEESRDCVEG